MPYVRLTVRRPLPGQRDKAREVLQKIEHLFSDDPSLLMGFEFGEGGDSEGPLGRVSVWETNTAANKGATSVQSIALRAELQRLCSEDIVDSLSEITHAHISAAAQKLETKEGS